ncbi:hypothetical protein FQA39_LY09436 [Lamprigera yunnana]|nr:hypothetical protein FQA39_LY09436 [Lamprigera yunnana]
MSSYVPCAVAGCDDKKSSRHRFPNPEKNKSRFDIWISLIANSKLVDLQPLEVYRNYRVCHQHFTMDDKSSNMYLKPVLSEMQPNIIGTPSTSTFGSDIRKHDVLSTHDQLLSKIPVPSTTFQSFSPSFVSESDEVIRTDKYILERSNMLFATNVFQTEGTNEKRKPPSLRNFISTLEGSFNQDPLENYFGQIRQHRDRHTNSTCAQFQDSFKALLIRSISGKHSVSANCEETFESSLLQLKDLVLHCTPNPQNNMHNIYLLIEVLRE